MVKVEIEHSKWGYHRLSIVNHAKSEVCNAASAIGWTIAAAIENFVPADKIMRQIYQDGNINIEVMPNDEYNMIFEIAFIGFKQLELNYPEEILVKVLES